MKNIKLEFSYDGTNFNGSQRQPHLRTVQGELENAIKRVTGEDVNMTFFGRTDAGVHAKYAVANFKTNYDIPGEAFLHKLVKYIPDDIILIKSSEVPYDFHSRFDAKLKRYRYIIYNEKVFYPYLRNYKLHIKYKLDINKMIEASKFLIGTHDFRAFMKLDEEKNSIRTIDDIQIYKNGYDIVLEFEAESFLYNQVRNMVGLLIDVGRGFRDVEYVKQIFEKNISRAAKTYGPQGLYLISILY